MSYFSSFFFDCLKDSNYLISFLHDARQFIARHYPALNKQLEPGDRLKLLAATYEESLIVR